MRCVPKNLNIDLFYFDVIEHIHMIIQIKNVYSIKKRVIHIITDLITDIFLYTILGFYQKH